MSDFGSNERRLLHALREMESPSVEDRARVRARVVAGAAAAGGAAAAIATKAAAAPGVTGGAASAATGAGTAGAAAVVAGSWKMASALVIAMGAAGGAAYVVATGDGAPPTRAPVRGVSSAVESTEPAPTRKPRIEVSPLGTPTASVKITAPSARRIPHGTTPSEESHAPVQLDEELVLLEQAQHALERGQAEKALASLNQHADEHPNGALASERQGVLAVALCESGQTTAGRRAAWRFLNDNPKSPLAARVRAACLGSRK